MSSSSSQQLQFCDATFKFSNLPAPDHNYSVQLWLLTVKMASFVKCCLIITLHIIQVIHTGFKPGDKYAGVSLIIRNDFEILKTEEIHKRRIIKNRMQKFGKPRHFKILQAFLATHQVGIKMIERC